MEQMTLSQIHEELRKLGCIGLIWSIEDVKSLVETDYQDTISDEDAWDILESVEQNHDCNYGVTWDNLHWEIKNYFENKEEE